MLFKRESVPEQLELYQAFNVRNNRDKLLPVPSSELSNKSHKSLQFDVSPVKEENEGGAYRGDDDVFGRNWRNEEGKFKNILTSNLLFN